MRALVLTNMYPSPERPALGRFVRDQVESLRELPGVDVEVFSFAGGGPGAYVWAARRVRRSFRGRHFDVVHAHFGLTAWPALAVSADIRLVTLHGTDLAHPRSRAITLAALPLLDRTAVVSEELRSRVPGWAARSGVSVLPCGVDLRRFGPIERARARSALGLDPEGRYLLFPADPGRAEKRHDLALALAEAAGVMLLSLGAVDPDLVPFYVNAANAVLVPSDREGFGLAVLEALACDVPVLATPHGVAPEALGKVAGTYCGPFSLERWGAELAPHLEDPDPRVEGRSSAERFSADAMAQQVADTWRELLASR